MKNYCLVVLLLITAVMADAQQYQWVKVTDWGKKGFLFSDGFWAGKKDTLEKQMGKGALDSVKKYSSFQYVPTVFQSFDGNRLKDTIVLFDSLSRLKVRKVAGFHHILDGKDWGDYTVVEAPYEPNKDWDPKVRWHKIYFIIEAHAVEEENK